MCTCGRNDAIDKTGENVREKVENILKEACLSRSSNVIERAHRIGSNYKSFKNNNNCCSVIVRFNSLKHRTWQIKGVRVKLDLTKKRYNGLRSARSIAD